MARSSSIEALPSNILDTLIQQYTQHPAWTLDDHIQWLESLGYKVSRSALHRYLFSSRETLLQAQADKEDAIAQEMKTRQRCLEIASNLYKGDNPKELIEIAEDLVDWIQQTDTSSLAVESFYRE
ncbi:phage protein Gp27 family protein [Ectopseudomonas khazarica]|uniref:phage protein Gp27 family protein n=1 Tax=Ectopseudomonas khazarica TaxID=2502979 RepID=UPI003B94C93E